MKQNDLLWSTVQLRHLVQDDKRTRTGTETGVQQPK